MAKRKAQHEHHGGAWKVAYSDFITSMMALFMVLWILSQNVEVKEQIQQYFLDPFAATEQRSPGVVSEDYQSTQDPIDESPPEPVISNDVLWELAKKFYESLNLDIDDVDKPIEIRITDDGLFISMFDRDDQKIFKPGTVDFTPWGSKVMDHMSWLIDDAQMPVSISSHIPLGGNYPTGLSGFQLTSAMSNAVMNELSRYGLSLESIHRVIGYGASLPVNNLVSEDPRNQRIELELTIPGTETPKSGPTRANPSSFSFN